MRQKTEMRKLTEDIIHIAHRLQAGVFVDEYERSATQRALETKISRMRNLKMLAHRK
jgi:hypothetical protein